MDNIELLEKQMTEYGNLDFSIITERPEGMPIELYKFIRKSSNKVLNKYTKGIRDNEISKIPKKLKFR